MAILVPAVIPESYAHLASTVEMFKTFSDEVQVDIVDGVFVPFTSWPYSADEEIVKAQSLFQNVAVEVDLMVAHPETVIEQYLDVGVRAVVVHLESTEHFSDILDLHRDRPFLLGISINNTTDLQKLIQYIPEVDYVQLMGVREIGSQGQPFDTLVLERIKMIKEQFPQVRISIDGSVNAQTIGILSRAGADRFVPGSSIVRAPDPKVAYTALLEHLHIHTPTM